MLFLIHKRGMYKNEKKLVRNKKKIIRHTFYFNFYSFFIQKIVLDVHVFFLTLFNIVQKRLWPSVCLVVHYLAYIYLDEYPLGKCYRDLQ